MLASWYLIVFGALGVEPRFALYLVLGKGTSAVHQMVEVVSDVLHPNPLPLFCKWGNLVPHPHLSGFVTFELGFDWFGSWGSTFIVGGLEFVAMLEVVLVVGGIDQSFLISKRMPGMFPALGEGLFSEVGGC